MTSRIFTAGHRTAGHGAYRIGVADLTLPRAPTQSVNAGFALAMLDDQLRRLEAFLEDWEMVHLEWQERAGRNTVGMILTHLAIVETVWVHIGGGGKPVAREARVLATLGTGLEAAGMPLRKKGRHPANLEGRTLTEYLAKLERARAETRHQVTTWTDDDLRKPVEAYGHTFTREWVLYHLVEHFAAHFGQIAMIAHAMRDRGIEAIPRRET